MAETSPGSPWMSGPTCAQGIEHQRNHLPPEGFLRQEISPPPPGGPMSSAQPPRGEPAYPSGQGRAAQGAPTDACRRISEQRADRILVIEQILRSAARLWNRRGLHIDAQLVVERGEYFLAMHRAI